MAATVRGVLLRCGTFVSLGANDLRPLFPSFFFVPPSPYRIKPYIVHSCSERVSVFSCSLVCT